MPRLRKVDFIPPQLLRGPPGIPGAPGLNGRDGKDGRDGRDGIDGITTVVYKSEVNNEEILAEVEKRMEARIKKTLRDIQPHGGPGAAVTSYNFVTTSEIHFKKSSFVHGTNIIGVRQVPCSVYIPHNLDREMHIVVNDETGTASPGNPITVTVE